VIDVPPIAPTMTMVALAISTLNIIGKAVNHTAQRVVASGDTSRDSQRGTDSRSGSAVAEGVTGEDGSRSWRGDIGISTSDGRAGYLALLPGTRPL